MIEGTHAMRGGLLDALTDLSGHGRLDTKY